MQVISQTAEYALRAVVCLASQPGAAMTAQQLAERTRVPVGYLSKVLQMLTRAGLAKAQRGLHGGFTLLQSPEQISVLQVVNAVDPMQRIRTCPLGIESHGQELCPMHRRIDDAMAEIEKAFAHSSIADLLNEPSRSVPLCEFGRPEAGKAVPAPEEDGASPR